MIDIGESKKSLEEATDQQFLWRGEKARKSEKEFNKSDKGKENNNKKTLEDATEQQIFDGLERKQKILNGTSLRKLLKPKQQAQ